MYQALSHNPLNGVTAELVSPAGTVKDVSIEKTFWSARIR